MAWCHWVVMMEQGRGQGTPGGFKSSKDSRGPRWFFLVAIMTEASQPSAAAPGSSAGSSQGHPSFPLSDGTGQSLGLSPYLQAQWYIPVLPNSLLKWWLQLWSATRRLCVGNNFPLLCLMTTLLTLMRNPNPHKLHFPPLQEEFIWPGLFLANI